MISTLLAQLDPLPYPERMRQLAGWARSVATPDDLHALRAEWPLLAVTAAVIRGGDLGDFLHDPDPAVQAVAAGHALKTGALAGDDLVRLYADASAHLRRVIVRTIRSARLTAAADTLIDTALDRYGDTEAGRLLPICSPPVVRRLLPRLDHTTHLSLLARRHPDLVLDRVEGLLAEAGTAERARLWGVWAYAVIEVGDLRVLDLIERYAPDDHLPGRIRDYGRLAALAPARVAALLSAPARANWLDRRHLPAALTERLVVLGDDELIPLARRLRFSTTLLAELPPSRRGAVYDASVAGVDVSADVPSHQLLDVLPYGWRVREARRILALDSVRASENETIFWSSYLPWDEAREVLATAVRSGSADDRSLAYRLLSDAARRDRDPAAVAWVVEALLRIRNEQDPVRASALTGLSRTARLLTGASAANLTRITGDAVEARDASIATLGALRNLAVAVLQHHVGDTELRDWSLLTLDLLSGSDSVPPLGRFDRTLRRGQETMVFDRLRPWIEAGMDRGRYAPLFAVTRALGRRAWRLPALQALLGRAVEQANVSPVISTAVDLWLAEPAHRPARAERVLAADASTVTLHAVWQTICAQRTDLLDAVLTGPRPAGRFLATGVRWVPHFPHHADRWLPRQRAAFVDLQAAVVADAGATVGSRASALVVASHAGGRELLLRYAGSSNVVLAEAALGALANTPDALAVLLEYADTDRARVVLYAAGRAVRTVPPSWLPALLGGIVSGRGKVTSRKEAARLLAAYGPPQAMTELLDVYRQDGQHRDVRAAIVAAARMRPQTASSWDILAAAASGAREEKLALLTAAPDLLAADNRPRYAALLVPLCRDPDDVVRDAVFLRLAGWLPYLTGVADVLAARFCDPDARVSRPLVAATLDHRDAAAVETALHRLVEADAADTDPGGPPRDRRARRRIGELAGAVEAWSHRGEDRTVPLRTARWLAGFPAFATDAQRLLTALVEVRMPDLEEIVTGRPVLAYRTAGWLAARVARERESLDPGILLDAAEMLRQRGDTAGGLLALALVRTGEHDGWTAVWRDLLLHLREHPDPDVRDEAFAVDMTAR